MSFPYRLERLEKQQRTDFDCGSDPLNHYLQKQASQDQRRHFSVCYLLIDTATDAVAGFYTLAACHILLTELPDKITKKLPKYPRVPAARLGRLAIDKRYQGKKLGGVLLHDAMQRAASTELGVYALVVDAKDDQAAAFYEHHGFLPLGSSPRILFAVIN